MRVGWSPVSAAGFQSTCRAADGCSYRPQMVFEAVSRERNEMRDRARESVTCRMVKTAEPGAAFEILCL